MQRNTTSEELSKASEIKYVFKGAFLGLVISLLVLLVIALILLLTSLSETVVPYAVYLTSIFSIIIGSAYAARRIRFKGWLNGGLTGLTYIVVLLLLTRVFGLDMDINLSLLTKLVLGFVIGSIGGILGLNF